MLEKKQEMLYDDPSKTFYGVYFVLLGFDLTTEEKVFALFILLVLDVQGVLD